MRKKIRQGLIHRYEDDLVMSLSASDLTELLELWTELNLTAGEHSNLSQVQTLQCSGAISHTALLHILSVLYVFIFVLGLAANMPVFWANLWRRWSRHETHLYIVQLAVADLSVLATLPVWVASLLQGGHWPFGVLVCKLTHLIFSVNLFSSIFFLTCMSVDRYLSATLMADTPPSRRKQALRRLVCVLVWLLALAASVPDTYFLQADGAVCQPVYPPDSARAWTLAMQLSFIVLGFAVPFPVIAVFSLLLAVALPPRLDQERHASRWIVLTYVVAFVVCWLPFHMVLLVDTLALFGVLPFSCRLENFLDVALHLTQCCSLLPCCINPTLYSLLHRRRRNIFKAVFFRYSAKTGLVRLMHASDSESVLTADHV
ncbi:hypothetical protein PAMP_016772 [Pampus punctatissimus]